MKFKLVSRVLGLLSVLISLSMIWPLLWSLHYQGTDTQAFLISIAVGIGSGLLMFLFGMGRDYGELGIREAFAVVSLSWVLASAIGALPFFFSGMVPSYTDAFFEAMSGFTTTGATILSEIETQPKGLLFWRSLTHWLGGMGIIVLSLAILPFIGVGGMQLFKAEVPGPTPEKLTPRIQKTAMLLWGVYVIISAAEVIALLLCGMDLYDSLTHTFGTMATGGFSPRNASIAAFESPLIEWVIIVFMFLAGTNFVLHYLGLRGKLKVFWKDEEFRFYVKISLACIIVFTLILMLIGGYSSPADAVRDAAFQVVSIMTTTGYTTADFELWPHAARFLLLLLMFVGGCSGSTGGSMKQVRIQILLKRIGMELKRLLHPQGLQRLRFNNMVIKEDVLTSVTAFFILYMGLFAGSTILIITLTGMDVESGIASIAATLGNIGPGLGKVGPIENYGFINIPGKWLLSFCMLLGRLELFSVIMLFVPGTWRQ
ncbi:MAG: TrkH family potassium uptake protein [Spirochaetales bacterium]|nr:TrkH family potassium uptake protein [Spirochaetales bacterium]